MRRIERNILELAATATLFLTACGGTPAPAVPVAPSASASASVSAPPATSAKAEAKAPAAGTVKIGEGDAGKSVDAKLGDTVELTLETNPSTGYDWQVDLVDKTLGQPKIVRPSGPPRAVGAPTTMTFVWKLAGPLDLAGAHPVTLAYRRPWEKDDPPEKTFKFTLRVAH